jgi:hypothetical protein
MLETISSLLVPELRHAIMLMMSLLDGSEERQEEKVLQLATIDSVEEIL